MAIDQTIAAKWPELALVLDPLGLDARFEEGEPEVSDDAISILSGQEDIGSIQILDPWFYEYKDQKPRYVAGSWCSMQRDAIRNGGPTLSITQACEEVVAMCRRHGTLA